MFIVKGISEMSNTEVSIPASFKEVLREKVLAAYVDMIPKEQLDALIYSEVDAWFNTPQLTTIEQTRITVANPAYDPKASSAYSAGNKTLTRDCLVFGSKMTPFRHMVWTTLHEHFKPVFNGIVNDSEEKLSGDLREWLKTSAADSINSTGKALFTSLAMGMSATMLNAAMQQAITSSHFSLTAALNAAGVRSDVANNLPTANPPFVPPSV